MTLETTARRTRILVTVTLGVMALANVGLAFALVREAMARKIAVIVPGVRHAREVPEDDPPTDVVRDFAFLYLAHFDSYTPATVEAGTRYLEGWLAPRFFTQATTALLRRKELVAQSRMASQIVLPRHEEAAVRRNENGEYEVRLVALRRVYIADKLQSENSLTYTVVIEPGTPTLSNPYGLYITGQLISPKVDPNATESRK